jgi:uridylate kinase
MVIQNPEKTYIFSVGGSLIVPSGGIDSGFLKQFNAFIREKIKSAGMRFFLVCGGGATARNYRDAASAVCGKSIADEDLDWLGIHASRLNAHLVRTIFRDIAYEKLIKHYDLIDKKVVDFPVVVAAGWQPGWSTDFDAVLLAQDYGIKTVLNLSNVDMVYNKDPNKYPDAKPLERMSWDDVLKIVGKKWHPGLNTPFDPVAAQKAKEIGLTVINCNGRNLENLDNILTGRPFVGTTIK